MTSFSDKTRKMERSVNSKSQCENKNTNVKYSHAARYKVSITKKKRCNCKIFFLLWGRTWFPYNQCTIPAEKLFDHFLLQRAPF